MIKYKTIVILIFSFFVKDLLFAGDEYGHEFIENKGQWNEKVQYLTPLLGGKLWIENDKLLFNYTDPDDLETLNKIHHNEIPFDSSVHKIKTHAFSMSFINRNENSEYRPSKKQSNYYNYFLGRDSLKWKGNVPIYKSLDVLDLYSGIDFKLHSSNGPLQYDFEVHPYSDPTEIRMLYEGVDLEISDGHLIIDLMVGKVVHTKPIAYQIDNGVRVELECNYVLDKNTISFEFPNSYDDSKSLIIDPQLIFSTYTGSTSDNFGFTATYDNNGNFYAGGISYGSGYPTTIGAYDTSYSSIPSSVDIVITKFTPDGTDLLYSTFVGGEFMDYPQSMVVDSVGDLLVYGSTRSYDFPVTIDAFQNTLSGATDIVVFKISENGSELLNSTFFGGSMAEGSPNQAYGSHDLSLNYADAYRGEVIIGENNSVYFTSFTYSPDIYTTSGAEMDSLYGEMDGLVVHMSEDLSEVIYSTYIGGSNDDILNSIKLFENKVIVGGGSNSSDFPVSENSLQNTYPGGTLAGVIATIDQSGAIENASYLGLGDRSMVYFVEIGPDNHIYAMGINDGDYPVSDGVYFNPYSQQFIQELNPSLSESIQSTKFGSSDSVYNHFSPNAFMVDDCGLIYISGFVAFGSAFDADPNFPTTSNAFQDTTDGRDFYFIVFNSDFESLLMASYYGDSTVNDHVDGGTSRFNKKGVIYQAACASCNGGSEFPVTPGVWSEINGSVNCNMVAMKIDMDAQDVDASIKANDTLLCGGVTPFEIQFENTGRSSPYSFWDFGDGTSSYEEDPLHSYDEPGTYTVTHILIDSTNCISSDTAFTTFELSHSQQLAVEMNLNPPGYCEDTMYVNLAYSGIGVDSLIWKMGDGTVFYGNPINYQYYQPGEYQVVLEAYDLDCPNDTTLYADFELEEGLVSSKIAVPNIFTPNNDGINDFFEIYYLLNPFYGDPYSYIEDLSLKIYNRWGVLVYESNNSPSSWKWNGYINGNVASEGVYYYILNFKSLCETRERDIKTGYITLTKQSE